MLWCAFNVLGDVNLQKGSFGGLNWYDLFLSFSDVDVT